MSTTVRPTKRQKVISSAVSLFRSTHDVKKVSLETIAEEARVSPTTIYNCFGNREALVYEVIKELVRANLERNRALIRSELPFPRKLIGIMSGKLALASQMNGEVIEKMVRQDKKIAPFVDEVYEQEVKPLWKELLADGKKQGYIDPALDDEALLIYLDVLKAGFSVRPEVLRDFKENMGLIERLMRLMFYGFMKKDIDLFRKEEE